MNTSSASALADRQGHRAQEEPRRPGQLPALPGGCTAGLPFRASALEDGNVAQNSFQTVEILEHVVCPRVCTQFPV